MTSTTNSDNKTLIKSALRMAWPSVIESFFVSLVGLMDSLMVSNLGAYAVAAVGLTTQPKFIGLALFFAINIAVSALVAWRKGENNRRGANQIFLTALCFSIVASLVIGALFVVLAGQFMYWAGAEADTHDTATIYLRIVMGGIIFQVISMVINAAQRGSGFTRISMRTNLTSGALNIVFNYLLINGNLGFPAWGVRGAAIGTVISSTVACGMSVHSLFGKDSFVQVGYLWQERIKPAVESGKQLVKFAYATFIEQLLLRFGFLMVALLVANLGTKAFAVQQVGMNIMGLSFAFGDGMQIAAVSLIGQSLGRGQPEVARRYGRICQRLGGCISLILATLYLLGGHWFYSLYFDEFELIDTGVQIMNLMTVIVLMQIAQVIYMGCLRGAGDVKVTVLISLIGVTMVRPLTSYAFAYTLGLGIIGIWLGVICDQFVRMALSYWRFKSGKWMKIKL
ncbi:MAG: MATE family efflux transporter [Lachnospiraceae bacterium]|jgi:putative MATE family efflux protein|nr:MATE family efflux transporter [Lachnospiraceae bacterium]